MPKAPLQLVKDRFQDKASLVKAVQALVTPELWLDRVNAEKGLERVSSRKLLHLHDVLSEVKAKFGDRAKLIDAVAEVEGHAKDGDFKKGLERRTTPALYDRYRAGQKRQKAAQQ